jgi:hypothetical protein
LLRALGIDLHVVSHDMLCDGVGVSREPKDEDVTSEMRA